MKQAPLSPSSENAAPIKYTARQERPRSFKILFDSNPGFAGSSFDNRAYVNLPTKITVSFHNFKSQNLKLSVSNPKSKYVAYLSVLSRISNCQSLGRKNKHEILKTDRIPAKIA